MITIKRSVPDRAAVTYSTKTSYCSLLIISLSGATILIFKLVILDVEEDPHLIHRVKLSWSKSQLPSPG